MEKLRTIGRYELHESLSRDPAHPVFRARDVHFDRTVAVRIITSDLSRHPEFRGSYMSDLRLHASLDHPNVVVVHDLIKENGEIGVVYQFARGGNLESRLAETISTRRVVERLYQLASGLAAAHAKRLVHKNLNPSQLLFDASDRLLLSGFGAATLRDLTQRSIVGSRASAAGRVTIYRAPEQFSGDAPTPGADVFSLGLIAAEMLVGEPIYAGDTISSALAKYDKEIDFKLRDRRPDVSRELEEVVVRCVERSKTSRWASGGEVVDALRPLVGTACA